MPRTVMLKILFTNPDLNQDKVADALVKISRYVREGYNEGYPLTTPGEMPGVEYWGVK
jgi:hypothetical protein